VREIFQKVEKEEREREREGGTRIEANRNPRIPTKEDGRRRQAALRRGGNIA
jgi:hypothetical protein